MLLHSSFRGYSNFRAGNGRDLGVAVEGLQGVLYPAFSLYNKGDQLSMVNPDAQLCDGNEYSESRGARKRQHSTTVVQSKSISSTQPVHATLLDQGCSSSSRVWKGARRSHAAAVCAAQTEDLVLSCVRACELLKALPIDPVPSHFCCDDEGFPTTSRTRAHQDTGSMMMMMCKTTTLEKAGTFPAASAARVWEWWRCWQRGLVQYVATEDSGRRLRCDLSQNACAAFGLFAGDRVKVPAGIATVLGCAEHKLWYCLDHSSALATPRVEKTCCAPGVAGEQRGAARSWSRKEIFELRGTAEFAIFSSKFASQEYARHSVVADDVPVEQMLEWFESWTPKMDARLVRGIERLSKGRHPFVPLYSELVEEDIGSPDSALHTTTLGSLLFPELAQKLPKSQIGPAVRARVALVLHLDELVSPLLPLLDLTESLRGPPQRDYAYCARAGTDGAYLAALPAASKRGPSIHGPVSFEYISFQ